MFGRKTKFSLCVFVVAYFVNYYLTAKVDSPIVVTRHGKLRGIVEKSRNGRDYFSYMNIPYADRPLRFELPQPFSQNWSDFRDASSFGPECLQFDLIRGKVVGDEDCLQLNIFTPRLDGDPMPIIVYIHGGSFITGSANTYNPKYFMDEDVIIISINYRLASLGFLNTDDGLIRGNMGLHDQRHALLWIQENIAAFNGNKEKVTIMGESSGGASVHFHLISPLSKGLYQRAIAVSGSAISHWATYKKPKEQAIRFAAILGCKTDNPEEMVTCLKNVDGYKLADAHKEVMTPLRDLITIFVPTIERFKDENSFLTEDPYKLLSEGKFNKIPYMAGVNSHEGLMYSAGLYRNETLVETLRHDFNYVTGRLLDIPPSETETLDRIRRFYLGENPNSRSSEEQFENYTNLFSDRSFFIPMHLSAEIQRAHEAPIYLYYYSYQRDISLAKYILAAKGKYPIILEIAYDIISSWIKENIFRMELPKLGVCHSDELGVFFPVLWDSDIIPGGKDYLFSSDIIKLWVSFASHDRDLEFRKTSWLPNNQISNDLTYMELNNEAKMIKCPFSERVDFWKSLNPRITSRSS